MSETPPAAPPADPGHAPPPRFEDFMSDSIGQALKENPKMPAVERDPNQTEPEPKPQQPAVAESKPEESKPEPKTPAGPEIPDFSKLAFGQGIAEKVAELEGKKEVTAAPVTSTVEGKEKVSEIPSPEHFPEKLPGKVTPQVEQAFGSMRKANKALFEQNADLTTKLKEAQERLKEFDGKAPMDKGEFDRLTGERDNLSKELRLVKLEATPEYKAAVTRPLEQIGSELKRLSTKYSLNEHQVQRAITEPDPDKQSEFLAQVTETFNDRDKITLFKVADAAAEISRKRDVLQKDVKQALDYIEAKRTADTEAKTAATKSVWTNSLTKAWDTIGESLYLARPMQGNDAWNQSLDQAKQLVANTNFQTLEPTDQAKIMVQAAILPRALIAITQLWNMYSEAAKTLKRYQEVTPGAGGGNSAAGGPAPVPPISEEVSFLDAVESRIKGR
jgi:predicted nuclease with TOPRIM domain